MHSYQITPNALTLEALQQLFETPHKIVLSDISRQKIQHCRSYLDRKMETQSEPVYGVTTGFGSLCNKSISREELGRLQENLVMSHACSVGTEVASEVVKFMLLLKAHALSLGYSGAQLITIERILDFYNNDIIPVVYDRGSLGASGDLAPLANLFLPLIGKGEVYFQGKKSPASEVLKHFGWEPVALQSKEGLALLNGTQFMSAHGVVALLKLTRLMKWADTIGALSLEAFDGRVEPFDARLHQIRPHQGQIATATALRNILKDSELISRSKKHVQDPYSFRCMPQVHGAVKDCFNYVIGVVLTEVNSVTDNPIVFPDDDAVISGGNFHGQPLALAYDFMAIALTQLGNISERRTAQLILGLRGLPEYLIAESGLNSGFMIPQYAAAALVNQNKTYSHPSSVDSIVSSNGQEDHVSMGGNAATKLLKILENVEYILAIELMNAAQAMEFRRPAKTSPVLEQLLEKFTKEVAFLSEDRVMYVDIQKAKAFIEKALI
ncbi:MAG: histidine ammonia-lyase [Bacteroidales bacterium]|nr:histidine ammonia-lyase [Bacteroidales bacterium]MCL2133175.1 histidine ammonia-lyase [Bacteroidales bacterium]